MRRFITMILDVLLPKRWYIVHESYEVDGMDSAFGPFRKRELSLRLSDEYAELLEFGDDTLYPVKLKRSQTNRFFVMPKDFWLEQAEALRDDDEPPLWRA